MIEKNGKKAQNYLVPGFYYALKVFII